MVDVVMGDIDGFETWANELLLWASNQRIIVETATGKIVRQDSASPLPPAPNRGSTTSPGSAQKWPSPDTSGTSPPRRKALLGYSVCSTNSRSPQPPTTAPEPEVRTATE